MADEGKDGDDFSASILSLKTYLRSICPCLLTLSPAALEDFDSQLSQEDACECISKFVSVPENEVLYLEAIGGDAANSRGT